MPAIAMIHNIFFTFNTHFTNFLTSLFATMLNIIIVSNYLCFYKSFFKIGMNYTGSLWCFPAFMYCPGPYFLHTRSKVSIEIQQFVGRMN